MHLLRLQHLQRRRRAVDDEDRPAAPAHLHLLAGLHLARGRDRPGRRPRAWRRPDSSGRSAAPGWRRRRPRRRRRWRYRESRGVWVLGVVGGRADVRHGQDQFSSPPPEDIMPGKRLKRNNVRWRGGTFLGAANQREPAVSRRRGAAPRRSPALPRSPRRRRRRGRRRTGVAALRPKSLAVCQQDMAQPRRGSRPGRAAASARRCRSLPPPHKRCPTTPRSRRARPPAPARPAPPSRYSGRDWPGASSLSCASVAVTAITFAIGGRIKRRRFRPAIAGGRHQHDAFACGRRPGCGEARDRSARRSSY